ncbi:hypothetical protein KIN20_009526 [Parelaphostrongylus tenuis]|uniref:Uncharacterized protein n=1 Tax=Parelaphostrongylus tenuis TaxID=148309 RepID=A0AAD5QKP8_PARTN|nr:hypothetical protein KIN20_009526 [Parelaphostrongylus tenuis]
MAGTQRNLQELRLVRCDLFHNKTMKAIVQTNFPDLEVAKKTELNSTPPFKFSLPKKAKARMMCRIPVQSLKN